MEELLKKFIGALPFFGQQLTAILTGPRTAILEEDLDSNAALQRALTFLAVAFSLSYIAQIPLIANSQSRLTFGIAAIHSAIAFILNVLLVILVWKLVGARLAGKKLVVLTCYFCGISTLLFLTAMLLAAGSYRLLDPVNFQHMLSGTAPDPSGLGESGGLKVFLVLLALGVIAVYAWIVYIWETYRELANLSKTRSAIALILFTFLSPVLLTLQLLIGYTYTGNGANLFVPEELVGTWESSEQFDAGGAHIVGSVTYQFAPPKYRIFPLSDYSAVSTKRGTNGKCAVIFEDRQSGSASLQGKTITLYPYHHTVGVKNGCTGADSNSFINLTQTQYQYQINQQPTGWTLCFSDRLGQNCLKARRP